MSIIRKLAFVFVLLSPMAANADPIVLTDSCETDVENDCVVSIRRLEVGGLVLDVTFEFGAGVDVYGDSDPFFKDNLDGPEGVFAAMDAILAVLNDSSQIAIIDNGDVFDAFGIAVANRPDTIGGYAGTFQHGVDGLWVNSTFEVDKFYDLREGLPDAVFTFARFTPVPEPGTLALLGIGLLGLGLSRRKKA